MKFPPPGRVYDEGKIAAWHVHCCLQAARVGDQPPWEIEETGPDNGVRRVRHRDTGAVREVVSAPDVVGTMDLAHAVKFLSTGSAKQVGMVVQDGDAVPVVETKPGRTRWRVSEVPERQ